MLTNKKISFIGAGTIAESLISGLLKGKLVDPELIWITNNRNAERLQKIQKKYDVNVTYDRKVLLSNANIVILAMKPKNFTKAMEEIKPYTYENQLFLSLVSVISSVFVSKLLGHKAPIIRACPNTPAAIGESATGLAPGNYVKNRDILIATYLFDAIGSVTTVTEKEIDAVTALAGSAPAYIFYLIEAMEKAGEALGLEKEVSKQLVVQSLIGSTHLIKSSSEETSTLYKQVMSPQGVTEAGFEILKQYKFQESIIEGIKRGTERSREIGEILSK
ncbi:pyrroline-5-carboxylate reductase [Virgibacillus profundi]|nr:pyrroline-5-carboxylate reductase [Virgibacillus profundi]